MAASTTLPRITIFGSLNIDMVSYVQTLPAPGETLYSTSFATSPGGKGANQAVACAKLSRSSHPSSFSDASATVAMVGAVGADSHGTRLRTNLSSFGVDVSEVRARAGMNTGVAVIVVEEASGENRIILSPEANGSWGGDGEFSLEMLGPRPDLLIMQLEIPKETVLAAVRAAKEAGVAVLLNPAPASGLGDEALGGLDHLVVNESEAAILTGESVDVLGAEEGMERVAGWFMGKGVRILLITLGARGVFFRTATGKRGLVPAEKVDAVVDTTAAGDTFVGQYALEIVASKGGEFDVAAAVRKANRAAAITVQRKGAQDSIPWRDEVV